MNWLKYENKAGYADCDGKYYGRELFFLAHVCFNDFYDIHGTHD